MSRNRIAQELDVATSTVTKCAQHAGIELDVAPADAIAGRVRQAEQARLELAGLAHEIAMKAGRKLSRAIGRDDYVAVRPLSVAFGIAADKEIELARVIPEPDVDESSSAREAFDGMVGAILEDGHAQRAAVAAGIQPPLWGMPASYYEETGTRREGAE